MTTATATRRERLERLVNEMKGFADECDAKEGGASGEDLAKLNAMGADVTALVEEVKAEAEANGTLDLAKSFLGDLAGAPAPTAGSNITVVNGIVDPKGLSLGEAFIKSPAFEEFVDQFKGADGVIRNVRNIKSAEFTLPGFGAKDLVTGASSTSGGAFVVNDRYGPVTDLIGERRLTVRDLCTNVTTNSDTFEFVQVTGKTNNAAGVAEATSAGDPVANTTTGVLEAVAGAGTKPESAMTFAVVSTPVETIAHLMPITRRAAADAPQVRQMVDAFLLYGLKEEEEDQILNGDGNSPNLDGILQTAGISTVGSAGTDLDAIVDAIRTIRLDRREPTAMVIHPNDWFSTGFLLAKDSAGNYLIGDPSRSIDDTNALWGLRVVVTPAMTENTVLVGDFRQAVVADRQQSAIYVTDSHKDWFGRNLLAVLAEERIALGVLDPDAFCTVTAV
jgi:HK97 family phage major capsid protein